MKCQQQGPAAALQVPSHPEVPYVDLGGEGKLRSVLAPPYGAAVGSLTPLSPFDWVLICLGQGNETSGAPHAPPRCSPACCGVLHLPAQLNLQSAWPMQCSQSHPATGDSPELRLL